MASMDLRIPMLSASSRARRIPAVSTSRTGMPPIATVSLTRISRGSGCRSHDGAFTFDQLIEQTRFADIGTAYDGERKTFMHDLSVGEGGCKLFKRASYRRDTLQDLLGWQDGDVIFGEVDAGFENRNQLDQFLFYRLQTARERAFELLSRNFCLIKSLGIDEITDCFGLGEIDASVEKSPHGELARFGQACAAGQSQFDDVAQDYRRTVSGNFDDVVCGVGMGLGEVGDDHFVDRSVSLG